MSRRLQAPEENKNRRRLMKGPPEVGKERWGEGLKEGAGAVGEDS